MNMVNKKKEITDFHNYQNKEMHNNNKINTEIRNRPIKHQFQVKVNFLTFTKMMFKYDH